MPVAKTVHSGPETAARQKTIAIESLKFKYPESEELILKDISISLPAGNFITLIGPNGAGKSTLFKLLVGLEKPLSGSVDLFGDSIKVQRKRHNISYIPQEEQIDWDYPILVSDVIKTGLFGTKELPWYKKLLPSIYDETDEERIHEVLKLTEMENKFSSPIKSLSGGQKRRVFLSRALVQEADLLLLDEPLAGVDSQSEEIIIDVMKKLVDDGKTIIMASHDIAATREYADLVVLLNGEIIKCGPPGETITREWIKETFGKNLHYL